MLEDFQKEYLKHLGLNQEFRGEYVPCEVCGCSEFTLIREINCLGKGHYGKLPVVSCNDCGFLFQNPRFERAFYDAYYGTVYRNVVLGNSVPSKEFVEDQLQRGRLLYQNLKPFLSNPGEMIDVGCSMGGLMQAFIDNGWKAYGTDPDIGFIKYGKEELKLPVECMGAEEMKLRENYLDLIIITGSLEHVFDPNLTLEICRKAAKKGSLLLLEARGNPQSNTRNYFNHNHHRYYTFTSMENMMAKHGWEMIWKTEEPITGPTRKGTIFALGRACDPLSQEEFIAKIKNGRREDPSLVLRKFDELDARLPN